MLRAIVRTIEAAHENDAWIGTYWGMPGSPESTEVLVRVGLGEVSRKIVTVPKVKLSPGPSALKSNNQRKG